MKYFSHLAIASGLIRNYDGSQPFHLYSKAYFRQHKKFGATDRKQINQLCFSYFRLGHALKELSTEEKLIAGLFLCSDQPNILLENLKPEWNELAKEPVEKKLSLIHANINDVYPWRNELSNEMDIDAFIASHFYQPELFVRARPGYEKQVAEKLRDHNIAFKQYSHSCFSVANSTPLDSFLSINKEMVIQDFSSQKIGDLLMLIKKQFPSVKKVWDCCAASGGKSIMAHDLLKSIDLTVSDIRDSILYNLERRFEEAGIKKYRAFLADLSVTSSLPLSETFDLIIADVPCSGSGTWSRTPEQFCYFNASEMERFSSLQQKIVSHAIPHLGKKGYFLYCTCSVFKKENEEVASFIQQEFHLKLIKMELLKGYSYRADTMFAALFSR